MKQKQKKRKKFPEKTKKREKTDSVIGYQMGSIRIKYIYTSFILIQIVSIIKVEIIRCQNGRALKKVSGTSNCNWEDSLGGYQMDSNRIWTHWDAGTDTTRVCRKSHFVIVNNWLYTLSKKNKSVYYRPDHIFFRLSTPFYLIWAWKQFQRELFWVVLCPLCHNNSLTFFLPSLGKFKHLPIGFALESEDVQSSNTYPTI